MTRSAWGVAVPLSVSAATLAVVFLTVRNSAVRWGIATGLLIALAQSFLSTGAMRMTWRSPAFFWVWGSGVLFRILVFAATAYVVYAHTGLHFVATMLSMVTATTLFLVVETYAFLNRS